MQIIAGRASLGLTLRIAGVPLTLDTFEIVLFSYSGAALKCWA